MLDRNLQRGAYSVGAPTSSLGILTIGVVAIAALYFAREVFVPLALAILLSFALGPLVALLRRWHFGSVPSVIAAVLLAFLVILGVVALIGGQITHLAENLPQYHSNIKGKIHSLRGSAAGSGIVGRASGMLKDLSNEITKSTPQSDSKEPTRGNVVPHGGEPQPPIPVEIHQPDATALQIIQAIIGPLVQPLATTGIVIVFVVFFLLQREDLRDRFIRLAGAHDLQRTTKGLDDAARRLSRYLLVQTSLNASFGISSGSGYGLSGCRTRCSGEFSRCCYVSSPTLDQSSQQSFPRHSRWRSTRAGQCCSGRVRCSWSSSPSWVRLSSRGCMAAAPVSPLLLSSSLLPSGHGFGDP